MFSSKRSASLDRRLSRTSRTGSGDRDKNDRQSVRTSRTSLFEPLQRAPDFRADKQKNISELISFLHTWKIENFEKYSTKLMQCPSSKMFLDIFNFLVEIIMPGYQLANRYEEDFVYIMKSIGYPYTINKSSVLSIAPHSWPSLCHALVILTRAIEEMPSAKFPDNQFIDCCLEIAAHPDRVEELQEQMRREVLEEKLMVNESCEKKLEAERREFEMLRRKVIEDEREISEMKQRNEEIEDSIAKLEEYEREVNIYLESKEEQLLNLDVELKRLSTLNEEVGNRRDALEKEYTLRTQELSEEDRKLMIQQKTQLATRKKQLLEDAENLQERLGDLEMKQCQAKDLATAKCKEFNHLVDTNMNSSVSDNLKVDCSVSGLQKLQRAVMPYLEKTRADLESTSERELKEKVKAREQTAANLRIKKAELDDLRRQQSSVQLRSETALSQLSDQVEGLSHDNEKVKDKYQKVFTARKDLEGKLRKEKEDVNKLESVTAESKKKYELEEERKVAKLKTAVEKYDTLNKKVKDTLRRQQRELSSQLVRAECLKAECENVKFLALSHIHSDSGD